MCVIDFLLISFLERKEKFKFVIFNNCWFFFLFLESENGIQNFLIRYLNEYSNCKVYNGMKYKTRFDFNPVSYNCVHKIHNSREKKKGFIESDYKREKILCIFNSKFV